MNTRDKIISTAERLFAEYGFARTSMRRLTEAAGVNLAAVNYHFKSKERLIEEILKRRLDWLHAERLDALEQLQAEGQPNLEAILDAFARPAVVISHKPELGGSAFVRLLARAYVENSDSLRRFISEHYGHVMRRYAQAIAEHVAHLSAEELYWRMDFIIGAMTYTMADFGGVKKVEAIGDEQQQQVVLQRLVHFAAAGLRAPACEAESAHTPLRDHFDALNDRSSA